MHAAKIGLIRLSASKTQKSEKDDWPQRNEKIEYGTGQA